jgi:hypothetical protein
MIRSRSGVEDNRKMLLVKSVRTFGTDIHNVSCDLISIGLKERIVRNASVDC